MANEKQAKFIIDVSAEKKRTRNSSVRFFSKDRQTAKLLIQAEKDKIAISKNLISRVEILLESVNASYIPDGKVIYNDSMTIESDGLFSYVLPDDLLNYSGLMAFEVYIYYTNGDETDSSNRIVYDQRVSAIDRVAGQVELVYIKDMETAKREIIEQATEITENFLREWNAFEAGSTAKMQELEQEIVEQTEIFNKADVYNKAEIEDKLEPFALQLAQTAEEKQKQIDTLQNASPSLGASPILPPSNIKVLSPLDGNARNYAGVDGVATGATENENVLFYKGMRFDDTQMVEYPVNHLSSIPSGTAFVRFKPLINFNNSLDMEHNLIQMVDSDGNSAIQVVLHYLDKQNYNGIEIRIRNGSTLRQLIVNNLDFNANEIYSLAVVWDSKSGEGNGNIACYINGLIQKATYWDVTCTPKSANTLRIGNQVALNRPAQCSVESVFFATEKIETAGILNLHRSPLKLEAVNNPNIYKPKYEVIGYKREPQDIVVLNYDKVTETLWGMDKDNRGVLLKSEDEGKSWETFVDFRTANTVIISLVEVVGNDLFVGVRDGSTGTLRKSSKDVPNFTTVLTFASGGYSVGGYNFDTYQDKIIVSEYGDPTTLARVFLSADGGNTFTAIKTLPANSRHIHASKFDPYTGYIWIDWGDNIEATEYSPDLGDTWVTVTNNSNHQAWDMVFTKDAVVFGSDSTAGGTLLRIYDKHTGDYKLLANPTWKYLNHVYAIDIDDKGYLWWYGNRESTPGVVSTIYISPDLGATPILVEDLGTELIYTPYRFVKTKDSYYLGNNKITQPLIKQL